jgi:hypothetical protein
MGSWIQKLNFVSFIANELIKGEIEEPGGQYHGLICYESLILKDRRRRPEGGEWEPIKIPRRNLAYIPNRTRRTSLLARLRPPSYRLTIGPRNRARNYSENTKWC